jgi:hypothetical protein
VTFVFSFNAKLFHYSLYMKIEKKPSWKGYNDFDFYVYKREPPSPEIDVKCNSKTVSCEFGFKVSKK